ncbi:MAG: MiaB/RimO family radical SAM methylthiotransferase [Candidatus Kerfeldbacteria bacterium]|nr:MiaB/RimO family radical SAM methylthiotransferase [Candidatus Kerfeldbacteria bacterium]
MKYFLLPLGCATNKADAERIAGVLSSVGYTTANSEEEADLIGVIACSIRQSAIDRVYGKVHQWNQWKKNRTVTTFVSGCMLAADQKKFLKLFDLVVPLDKVPEMPHMLKEYGTSPVEHFWDITPKRQHQYKALVPIQNGCDKFCTYCAVPYTRGREVSRSSKDILKEVESLIQSGVRQITLLGQNVNSYGLDKKGEELSFAQLLDAVGTMADKAPHRVWIHYTSPHPRDMTREVLEVQAKHPSLAHYLNLPLQSGNNDVLKKMNRRYTVEHYMTILDLAREIIPDMTVSTDIIVGFCDETEEQFTDTCRAVERAHYDIAFIAQYSVRPGVVAEKRFADTVAKDEKKRRHTVLTDILKIGALNNNQQLVGKTIPALVETASRKDGKLLARTEGLKSIEFASTDESLIGHFVLVRVESCDAWRLSGTYLSAADENPIRA